MRNWISQVARRLGNSGAIENVRQEMDTRRFQLRLAEALAERLGTDQVQGQEIESQERQDATG